jgi:hypothetical protein
MDCDHHIGATAVSRAVIDFRNVHPMAEIA